MPTSAQLESVALSRRNESATIATGGGAPTGNQSNGVVFAAGSPTGRTLADWMKGIISIQSFGVVGDGQPADDAFTAAAEFCRTYPGTAVYLPPGRYPILTGNINAMRATFVGPGGKVITPTSGTAPWETIGGATIELHSTSNPAFLLGMDSTFRGLIFWWPGQAGAPDEVSSSVTVYPALFAPLTTDLMSRIVIDNCAIINAYRFIDIGSPTTSSGDIVVQNCSIFAIKTTCRILGTCPEYIRWTNNFISYGLVGTILSDNPAMGDEYVTSGVVVEVDCGGGTGTASLDGFFWDADNFVFGARTFLSVLSGTLNVCEFSGTFDGVGTVMDWASTGGCNSVTWDGAAIYSYVRSSYTTIDAAGAATVFKARNATASSEFNFNNVFVNYAQGTVWDLQPTARQVSVSNCRVQTHGQSTTTAAYYAVQDGAGVSRAIVRGNIFNAVTNVATSQNGVQVGASPLADVSDNDFGNLAAPIVTGGTGNLTLKNNKTTNTRGVASVVIAGTGQIVGHNSDNTFDKPIAALGQWVVLPDSNSDAASTIVAGVKSVVVDAVTTNANDWLVLPTIASVGVGFKIKGWSAVAHEIRTPASSTATINNVNADGTNEAAIPATTLWEVESVTSTGWLLRAWDELGAPITAIVPD